MDNLVNQYVSMKSTYHTILVTIKSAIIGYLIFNIPKDVFNYSIISNDLWLICMLITLISSFILFYCIKRMINNMFYNIEKFNVDGWEQVIVSKYLTESNSKITKMLDICTSYTLYLSIFTLLFFIILKSYNL